MKKKLCLDILIKMIKFRLDNLMIKVYIRLYISKLFV
jgi:hypothetical protein